MTHRDKEQARALEYARSQGWGPPSPYASEVLAANARIESLERGQQLAVDALGKASEKVADLEVALAAERESHAVTKRAVLRGSTPVIRKTVEQAHLRIKALENALEQHVEWMRCREKSKPFDVVERVSVERAEALLK